MIYLQWTGPSLALVTVLTIWFGHVMVRKVNYHFGTKPVPVVALVGVGALVVSLFIQDFTLSGGLGIIGITTLWDAFELVRQENRIKKGHAPMNPKRPIS